MEESAVSTNGLTKRFGAVTAVDGLTLDVPRGVVFGFLGPNGAGKTTTIRMLMGMLRPTQGAAAVLGLDASRERDQVHRRTGYLPGEFTPDAHLTGEQYLRYLASLRGGVNDADVALLAKRLDVGLGQRIGSLSHGNRQKLGLIQAFMHGPELLVLDEPTIGLDPLVQHEFLAMVREARDEGRTVFLSSHILDEVEECADVVAIMRRGHLVVVDAIDELKRRARRRVVMTFTGVAPVDALRRAEGVAEVSSDGSIARVVVEGSMEGLLKVAAPFGIRNVAGSDHDLEEIFLGYYQEGRPCSEASS